MPVKTSEEAKNLIEEWLVSRGFPAKEVDREGTVFQIESKTPIDIAFTVIQPINLLRSVFIITKVDVDSAHLKALKSRSLKKRIEFIWSLKKELMTIPRHFCFDQRAGQKSYPNPYNS